MSFGSFSTEFDSTLLTPSPESTVNETISPDINYNQYYQSESIDDSNKYTVYPITENQLFKLFQNDLKQRKNLNEIISQRLFNDKNEFQQIENVLNEKIKKYETKIKEKGILKDNNYLYVNELLTAIINLEKNIQNLQKEKKKNKYQKVQNGIFFYLYFLCIFVFLYFCIFSNNLK